jgi:penicillin-binding protein 2
VEARRSYPSGDLTSHIVGYVGSISEEEYASLRPRGYILSDQVGKTGIEADYEDVLRGKPGEELAEVDASGRQLDVLDARAAQPGQSVFLTIDLELQRKVTEALREYRPSDSHGGDGRTRRDPGDGLPAFDNNLFRAMNSKNWTLPQPAAAGQS